MSIFEFADSAPQSAVIKVIGVGGGGGNAVEHMVVSQIEGVEFICANTDSQALEKSSARVMKLGESMTKGLGAGANPDIGRQAALESRDAIEDVLAGADMVFITAGMGGGTGTGGAPIVAEIARNMGILTVAVVTKPFGFEGRKRSSIADRGIQELAEHVDSLIVIPNNKLLSVLGRQARLIDGFNAANDVLLGAVRGISDLIMCPGLINVDFADVKTVMSENGIAMMGTGKGAGEEAALEAAEQAIRSPLLEDIDLQGAKGMLVNITAGLDFPLGALEDVGDIVHQYASDEATIVVGTAIDPEMSDEVHVTVVATGIDRAGFESETKPNLSVAGAQVVKPVRKVPERAASDELDRPAYMRRQEARQQKQVSGSDTQRDMLDVPAFLRHQAD